jgi:hypothetical protein
MLQIKSREEIIKNLDKFKSSRPLEYLISKQFANLFSSYTQSFNKTTQRMGSLFIPNFRRKLVLNDNYISALILYIHLNPVHHGFVDDYFDWPWSSYHDIAGEDPEYVDFETVLNWFGGKEEFIQYHKMMITSERTFQKFQAFQKF